MFHGFIGEYHHNIDAKKRVMVPAKFREAFAGKKKIQFFLTRGPNRCIFVFTPDQWKHWEESLDSTTETKSLKSEVRDIHRAFYANARHVACDKLGRIVVPQVLVDHAELKGEIVFTGINRRMEIWSVERWNDYQKRILEDFDRLADQIYE